ncbi:hypothetical protein ONZ27_005260 [Salmonella enterica subsp. enterica serovar Chandans]|nr:hypothetical protein [Salmonella enterica subsp. enterica serovar Chandans]
MKKCAERKVLYYDRLNQGSNTYRLNVYFESNNYNVSLEHFVKVPSAEPGKGNTKKMVSEQKYNYSSLKELHLNNISKIQPPPFRHLMTRLFTHLQEVNYDL